MSLKKSCFLQSKPDLFVSQRCAESCPLVPCFLLVVPHVLGVEVQSLAVAGALCKIAPLPAGGNWGAVQVWPKIT